MLGFQPGPQHLLLHWGKGLTSGLHACTGSALPTEWSSWLLIPAFHLQWWKFLGRGVIFKVRPEKTGQFKTLYPVYVCGNLLWMELSWVCWCIPVTPVLGRQGITSLKVVWVTHWVCLKSRMNEAKRKANHKFITERLPLRKFLEDSYRQKENYAQRKMRDTDRSDGERCRKM